MATPIQAVVLNGVPYLITPLTPVPGVYTTYSVAPTPVNPISTCSPVELPCSPCSAYDLDLPQSRSGLIILIFFCLVVVSLIFIGAYFWLTVRSFRQRRRTTGVQVPTSDGNAVSLTFTMKYIRTTSGYWIDNGGTVGFSPNPQQQWNFDGNFLTNAMTYTSLYTNLGSLGLGQLPGVGSSRGPFRFIFDGQTLAAAMTATTTDRQVVTDTGNSPTTGQLQLYNVPVRMATQPNQILYLT